MANKKKEVEDQNVQDTDLPIGKSGKSNIFNNLTKMINRLSYSTYGLSSTDDNIAHMNARFNEILQQNENGTTNGLEEDTTSFISKLFTMDRRNGYKAPNGMLDENQLTNLFADNGFSLNDISSIMDDAFRNRYMKQNNIHDISTMLIELQEAVNSTRDAILGSDIVTGDVNRIIHFNNLDEDKASQARAVVEQVEKRLLLPQKIKKFIIPHGLEYGNYYAYAIPYKKIFNDFLRAKNGEGGIGSGSMNSMPYTESTVYDYVHRKENAKKYDTLVKESAEAFFMESGYSNMDGSNKTTSANKRYLTKEYQENVDQLLKNVVICNDPVPINVLDEGVESVMSFANYYTEATTGKKKSKTADDPNKDKSNLFKRFNSGAMSQDGVINDSTPKDLFNNIKDVYTKMIDPLHMIPVKIMEERIGYYYIIDESISPTDGIASDAIVDAFTKDREDSSVVDFIATQIVDAFDKEWLNKNIRFKKLIVDAIQYYNINERRIKFQFIPAEYIWEFPVNVDETGEGRSMLEPSLFYANLYMLLLMFYIMSTVQYSNDTKVNYVKNSGIDKDTRSKIEEIARKKQARNINLLDMFSYSTVLNKVANGNEIYYPGGKSGDRVIETEIISGEDVKMNTELMEILRTAYILGTGVPSAIINYLNEADFSRQIQLANTKFAGRVISYQIDYNQTITEFYRGILRMTTELDDATIEAISYELPATKMSNDQIMNELIQNYNTRFDMVKKLITGEEPDENLKDTLKAFALEYAKEYIPSLEIDRALEIFKKAQTSGILEKLKPSPANDDADMDLSDEDLGI